MPDQGGRAGVPERLFQRDPDRARGQPDRPARRAGSHSGRPDPCRHPCRYHVHRRQPDAGSGLQRIPEHPAGVRQPIT